MTINTKFDINQEVYVINDDKIVKGKIDTIIIKYNKYIFSVEYDIILGSIRGCPWTITKKEKDVYTTIEDIINDYKEHINE